MFDQYNNIFMDLYAKKNPQNIIEFLKITISILPLLF